MRLLYFKQLIGKFKKHQKQSTNSEEEESMMLDYLVKIQDSKNCGEPTYFSGMLSSKNISQNPSQLLSNINRNTITMARF
jgi:hypothetical protein